MEQADLRFVNIRDLQLENSVKAKLSLFMRNIETGSSSVITTPILKSHSVEDLTNGLDKLMSQIQNINANLGNLEDANRSKIGPRSIAKPWAERKESIINSFGKGKDYDMKSFSYPNLYHLRPIAFDSALRLLKNNTNAGLPTLDRKSIVKEAYSISRFNKELESNYPCVLFTRTQEGNKTRDVWGYPFSDTLNEMKYYKPLLEYQKTLTWRSALKGPEFVNSSITNMFRNKDINDRLISSDFSSYDTFLKSSLQSSAFKYIKSLFQRSHHQTIDNIATKFKSVGIVTPDGVIYGDHGVPSGSVFTNEVDSIAHWLISSASKFKVVSQIQGDDGAHLVNMSNVDQFLESFESFGLKINKEKSYVASDYLIYLQNLFDVHYSSDFGQISGIYPVYRALNRIMYQERWSDFESYGILGKDYYSIRTISILENCKHHPAFYKFVEFIRSKDKYVLEYSQNALKKMIEMQDLREGSEGLILNQFGDDLRGLNNFETVKILKSMR